MGDYGMLHKIAEMLHASAEIVTKQHKMLQVGALVLHKMLGML
jgi:hypothetical protein